MVTNIFSLLSDNVSLNVNPVGKHHKSLSDNWKSKYSSRSLFVHGLFGGKKDNNEKSDDASSKINHSPFHWIEN